ncbi:MAG: hypothetical protein KKG60_03210 [Nanoarchaeota archaeon]|nr:hypothetical protein [Nanoarchaeota archaeon]
MAGTKTETLILKNEYKRVGDFLEAVLEGGVEDFVLEGCIDSFKLFPVNDNEFETQLSRMGYDINFINTKGGIIGLCVVYDGAHNSIGFEAIIPTKMKDDVNNMRARLRYPLFTKVMDKEIPVTIEGIVEKGATQRNEKNILVYNIYSSYNLLNESKGEEYPTKRGKIKIPILERVSMNPS